MPLPDLAALPGWAQFVVYAVFGFSLAVAGVVSRFGFFAGRKGGKDDQHGAQVAAVIVDSKELHNAAAAGEAVAMAILELKVPVAELAKSMEKLAGEMDEMRQEMTITREVARVRRGGGD